jgi:CPA2 family monovalent cation:H+ antiporter-2
MNHVPQLVTDLTIVLVAAGITTILFRLIRQPVVLGYIIAGFLVGPQVSLLPTVADAENLRTWSEIGVIFLLFTLGLEFSFKKLAKVGGSASVTALVGIVLMIGLGFLTGRLLQWSIMDSIFLGAILSISSTMITIRALDELGYRTRKFVSVVFGALIIQDLVAVLLLVLLSTLAASKQFAGWELITQIFKLSFFLVLWFVAGIFFVPTLIKRMRSHLNDETMLIVSLALCLAMVLLAVAVGFSAALGAFIMGSILAETPEAERIEHLVKPVRDLFAAIFFVSVGFLIEPAVLKEHAVAVIIIIVITIFGKLLTNMLGALLAGQSLKHSVQTGSSLAQIGEFSFIIAALGVAMQVTADFLYPVSVAVAVATAFTTPILIRNASRLHSLLSRTLPAKWVAGLNRYSTSSQQLSAFSEWRELLRAYATTFVTHSVIIIAIIVVTQRYIYPYLLEFFPDSITAAGVTIVVTLILMVPFIWALAIRRVARQAYASLWLNRTINRGPLIALEISRSAIAVLLVTVLFRLYFSVSIALVVAIVAMAVAVLIFSRKLQAFYEKLERRFLTNLNDREAALAKKREITPWDAHLAEFHVTGESPLAGKQLIEMQLREKYGINIALIERGQHAIIVPDRYERVYPGDKLSVIGTDDQLTRFKDLVDQPLPVGHTHVKPEDMVLQNFTIAKESRWCNQSIDHTGIRETGKALVVGVERNGERFLNPHSSMVLQEGDVIWLVGVRDKIRDFDT